jgi:tetratricopeptide (TPR) repeat protein
MQNHKQMQEAIAKARAGQELTARNLFLEIVQSEPRNELAWLWLIGLLDDLDDRIYACQKVLKINPANTKVKLHLEVLLAAQKKAKQDTHHRLKQQVRQIREISKKDKQEALRDIRELTREQAKLPEAWRLLAELSDEIDERARALENFLRLSGKKDEKSQGELETLRYQQENPLSLATSYEEQGKYHEAIQVYSRMMSAYQSSDPAWNNLYNRIHRAEKLLAEKLPRVSPALTVLRTALGLSLLYPTLLLIHAGFRPFQHPQAALWLGYVWVLLGSFMIALASSHSPERLQYFLYRLMRTRTFPAALGVRLIGYVLFFLPHLLLFLAAYLRFRS